jgi:Fe-S cluster biogenesis protein NfuA/nitrite reductase/ring-hydroxylating ferredoxin subunit
MPHRPEDPEDDAKWRSAGDRIQTLLDASSVGGAAARERAEQLVGEVTDLYGAALERITRIVASLDGPADAVTAERLAADDLVASLLLVHGLHPHAVERRISDALESVRPYLGSHGGDVHLLEVAGDVVRLQFSGSCKSCPSSAVTLELAVEDAVRAAAPEISSIEVVAAEKESTTGVIPADSLLNRVHANRHAAAWHPVPDLADLSPGEVGGFQVAGLTVLACRVGDDLFAYEDRCGSCGESLRGAALHRRMGSSDVVLRCARCHAHFDVVHAGMSVDDGQAATHLNPMPLLERDGVLSLAVPEGVAS